MQTVANANLGGWIGVDPDQIRQELEGLFPGVTAWFGEFTGSWWALLGGRLVEAADPMTLADRIRSALTPRPAPRPCPAHRSSTTGAFALPVPAAAPAPTHTRPAGLLRRAARLFTRTTS